MHNKYSLSVRLDIHIILAARFIPDRLHTYKTTLGLAITPQIHIIYL